MNCFVFLSKLWRPKKQHKNKLETKQKESTYNKVNLRQTKAILKFIGIRKKIQLSSAPFVLDLKKIVFSFYF